MDDYIIQLHYNGPTGYEERGAYFQLEFAKWNDDVLAPLPLTDRMASDLAIVEKKAIDNEDTCWDECADNQELLQKRFDELFAESPAVCTANCADGKWAIQLRNIDDLATVEDVTEHLRDSVLGIYDKWAALEGETTTLAELAPEAEDEIEVSSDDEETLGVSSDPFPRP